jgi:TolA-binding protein
MYRIADTQFGLGQFAEARTTYSRLLATYPDGAHAANASFGLANCAYNLGENEAAITAFSSFLNEFPNDDRVGDAELGIQSCYYRGGKDMAVYLAQHPDSPLAADVYWNQGQEAFNQGEYKSAVQAFERVTLDYPGSESGPNALFFLAESYYRLEEYDQALAGYRNFISTHPGHDLAELTHFRTATVLFKLERFGESAQAYETATDLFPTGEYAALASYNAAVCYQELEDWPAAIGAFVRFKNDFPSHEKAEGLWLQVASIYQEEIGDPAQAIATYDKALQGGEAALPEIRFRQGECYEKATQLDQALKAYRAADTGPATDPFRIAALAQIGKILEDRGDWLGAIEAYQAIVDAHGKPEWTEMAQGRIAAIRESENAGS